jgi:hypothetical protein
MSLDLRGFQQINNYAGIFTVTNKPMSGPLAIDSGQNFFVLGSSFDDRWDVRM